MGNVNESQEQENYSSNGEDNDSEALSNTTGSFTCPDTNNPETFANIITGLAPKRSNPVAEVANEGEQEISITMHPCRTIELDLRQYPTTQKNTVEDNSNNNYIQGDVDVIADSQANNSLSLSDLAIPESFDILDASSPSPSEISEIFYTPEILQDDVSEESSLSQTIKILSENNFINESNNVSEKGAAAFERPLDLDAKGIHSPDDCSTSDCPFGVFFSPCILHTDQKDTQDINPLTNDSCTRIFYGHEEPSVQRIKHPKNSFAETDKISSLSSANDITIREPYPSPQGNRILEDAAIEQHLLENVSGGTLSKDVFAVTKNEIGIVVRVTKGDETENMNEPKIPEFLSSLGSGCDIYTESTLSQVHENSSDRLNSQVTEIRARKTITYQSAENTSDPKPYNQFATDSVSHDMGENRNDFQSVQTKLVAMQKTDVKKTICLSSIRLRSDEPLENLGSQDYAKPVLQHTPERPNWALAPDNSSSPPKNLRTKTREGERGKRGRTVKQPNVNSPEECPSGLCTSDENNSFNIKVGAQTFGGLYLGNSLKIPATRRNPENSASDLTQYIRPMPHKDTELPSAESSVEVRTMDSATSEDVAGTGDRFETLVKSKNTATIANIVRKVISETVDANQLRTNYGCKIKSKGPIFSSPRIGLPEVSPLPLIVMVETPTINPPLRSICSHETAKLTGALTNISGNERLSTSLPQSSFPQFNHKYGTDTDSERVSDFACTQSFFGFVEESPLRVGTYSTPNTSTFGPALSKNPRPSLDEELQFHANERQVLLRERQALGHDKCKIQTPEPKFPVMPVLAKKAVTVNEVRHDILKPTTRSRHVLFDEYCSDEGTGDIKVNLPSRVLRKVQCTQQKRKSTSHAVSQSCAPVSTKRDGNKAYDFDARMRYYPPEPELLKLTPKRLDAPFKGTTLYNPLQTTKTLRKPTHERMDTHHFIPPPSPPPEEFSASASDPRRALSERQIFIARNPTQNFATYANNGNTLPPKSLFFLQHTSQVELQSSQHPQTFINGLNLQAAAPSRNATNANTPPIPHPFLPISGTVHELQHTRRK